MGSCIVIVGRNTAAGMPPSSFAHLPQIRPLQGRSVHFRPIRSGARRAAAGRAGPLPRPANTAPGRMGPKWTDVFLCHRPFSLELFTEGSLDVFSKPTNIRTNSRILSYDISSLGGQLKTIGTLMITDAMINRVSDNWRSGKRTHLITDEFHVMLGSQHGAEFFDSAWRRYRKRNGFPVAATQNVEFLLDTVHGSTMVSNSECVVMLNQSMRDTEKLIQLFHISDDQARYITNAQAGSGLLRYAGTLIPFVNRFKKDTELYRLITTKPGEVQKI